MNLKQLLEKQEEKLIQKFGNHLGCAFEEIDDPNPGDEMKSFLRSSNLEVLKAVREMIKTKRMDGGGSSKNHFIIYGYNKALNDIIKSLDEATK